MALDRLDERKAIRAEIQRIQAAIDKKREEGRARIDMLREQGRKARLEMDRAQAEITKHYSDSEFEAQYRQLKIKYPSLMLSQYGGQPSVCSASQYPIFEDDEVWGDPSEMAILKAAVCTIEDGEE